MSVPHSDIYCTHCDYHGRTNILNGGYWYYHEGVFCHLDKQYGWCQNCNDLVPMELLHNLNDQLDDAFDEIAEKVSHLVAGKVRFNFTEASRSETESTLGTINAIKLKYQIHSKRKGQERCLRCGSHNVTPAEEFNTLRKSIDEVGQTATGYRHPGCGGEFVLVPSSIRLNIAYRPKCYTFDGEFIDDELPNPRYGRW